MYCYKTRSTCGHIEILMTEHLAFWQWKRCRYSGILSGIVLELENWSLEDAYKA